MKRRKFLETGIAGSLGLMAAPGILPGSSQTPRPAPLLAGAATANITPLMNVPLDGVIMQTGPAKRIHDELHARCLVLDDGSTRLALAVIDNTMITADIHQRAKKLIQSNTGIPPECVLLAATHSHSTPRAVTGLKPDSPEHSEYLDYLGIRISEGVRRAAENLSPAAVGWGSAPNSNHVFNRRWWLKKGVQLPDPFGNTTGRVAMSPKAIQADRPAGPVDPEVFVLAVRHSDGRPLALLANYGLHYVGGVPLDTVSADYFGVFSESIRRKLAPDSDPPFVAMMSNGTSGDVNANNILVPRKQYASFERMKVVADDLVQTILPVYEKLDWHDDLKLSAAFKTLSLGVRKPDDGRLAWAEQMIQTIKPESTLTRTQVYAREALALNNYPATVDVPIQALRIGDLVIGAIPAEVFAETGLYLKANAPFPGNTFIMELANGYFGYLPTEEQHKLGGYETWPARSSFLEVQADSKIRSRMIALFNELKSR